MDESEEVRWAFRTSHDGPTYVDSRPRSVSISAVVSNLVTSSELGTFHWRGGPLDLIGTRDLTEASENLRDLSETPDLTGIRTTFKIAGPSRTL